MEIQISETIYIEKNVGINDQGLSLEEVRDSARAERTVSHLQKSPNRVLTWVTPPGTPSSHPCACTPVSSVYNAIASEYDPAAYNPDQSGAKASAEIKPDGVSSGSSECTETTRIYVPLSPSLLFFVGTV